MRLAKVARCKFASLMLFFVCAQAFTPSLVVPAHQHSKFGVRKMSTTQKCRRRASLSMALEMDSLREGLRTGIEVTAAAGSALLVTSIFARAVTGSNQVSKKTLTLDAVTTWFQGLTQEQQKKFAWCLFLDILGGSPELIFPGPIGEGLDGVWAPLYAFFLFQTFGARSMLYKTVLAVGGFLEEVLPFVSIVPSATIGFLLEVSADSTVQRLSDTLDPKEKQKDADK